MMARPTRTTDYRCTNGHTFYSWANTPVTVCPYARCDGKVVAVKGPHANKGTGR
jgi:hypothetical protein